MAPSMSEVRLPVSVFADAYSIRPERREVLLPELAWMLTRFPVRPRVSDKLTLPAWSPASFAPGRSRAAASVVAVSCLVFDLDEAGDDSVVPPWSANYWIEHSSWSHSPDRPRLRVVVPLATVVPVHRWADAWTWASTFVPNADRACKDPSRLYLLPAVSNPDAARHRIVHEGPLFDLLGQLPPPLPPAAASASRRRIVVPPRLAAREVAQRLSSDEAARERAAEALGATIAGAGPRRRAEHIPCPGCSRRSAWFWTSPARQSRVYCQHRSSCGWSGRLVDLLAGWAA